MPGEMRRVTMLTATSPDGTEQSCQENARGIGGREVHRAALRLPAELAGQPRDQPDSRPGRLGWIGRDHLDHAPTRSGSTSRVAGAIEELRDQLAPAGQAEPRAVAAASAEGRVEAQAEGAGLPAGVGQVENKPRALVGQIAKEPLVLPRVAGPPEQVGQVSLEQGPDGSGKQVDGIRPGSQHDPFGAYLRQTRRWQMAKRRDFGRDLAFESVRCRIARSPGMGSGR